MQSSTKFEASEPGKYWFFRGVFLTVALYNALLGAIFFLFYRPLFDGLGIELPYNTSYIHLTAAFVFVQGVGYWFVYRDMVRNVDLVKLGVIYKGVYSGLAFYYLATGELLNTIFAWFAVLDVIFLALFVVFLMTVRQQVLPGVPTSPPGRPVSPRSRSRRAPSRTAGGSARRARRARG
jgi:hypothetical protein